MRWTHTTKGGLVLVVQAYRSGRCFGFYVTTRRDMGGDLGCRARGRKDTETEAIAACIAAAEKLREADRDTAAADLDELRGLPGRV